MIRKLARPMLASVFVWEGVDNLRNASEHVKETEGFLKSVRKAVPSEYPVSYTHLRAHET